MIRAEKNQQSREAIRCAAIEEFGKHGYEKASLNTALAAAGVSKGRAYHYFDSKDQLYLECVSACFDALMQRLQPRREESASITLQDYFLLRLDFFEAFPAFAHIFMEAVQRPPAHLREEIKKRKVSFDQFNLTVFQKQLAHLRLRASVSEEDAMVYFQVFQEMFHQLLTNADWEHHEQQLKKTLDILLYGIAREDDTL